MKTTVDLPDDLHRTAKQLAEDMSWTLSEAIAWLMRRGLGEDVKPVIGVNRVTGFPAIWTGRPITPEDVERSLEDEE
jgi:predicted transcriptional regulator